MYQLYLCDYRVNVLPQCQLCPLYGAGARGCSTRAISPVKPTKTCAVEVTAQCAPRGTGNGRAMAHADSMGCLPNL